MNVNSVNNAGSDFAYKVQDAQVSHAKEAEMRAEIKAELKAELKAEYQRGVGEYAVAVKKANDDETIQKSVDQANKTLQAVNRHIERHIHEGTGAMIYELKDNNTGEVIAEFPQKKIQDMIAKMWEIAGLFVDEKA